VLALGSETLFGAPSFHAKNAVVFWGLLARGLRKLWVWFVAVFLILMIGLSRLYVGVHFPSDVVLGWIVGALTLWFLLLVE